MPISRIDPSLPATPPISSAGQFFNKKVTFLALAVLAVLLIYMGRSLYIRISVSAEDLLASGEDYAKKGDYQNAIASFSAALERIFPDDALEPTILSQRAQAYAELNEHSKAIDDYTKVLACKSGITDRFKEIVLFNRGISQVSLGQYEEAIKDFTAALELHSDDIHWKVNILENRAIAHRALGNFDQAIEDFTAVLNNPPDNQAICLYLRGTCYRKKEQFDLALKDHADALACNPEDSLRAEILYDRGKVYSSSNQEEAVKDFTAALECNVDPASDLTARILSRRAAIYEAEDKQESALVDLAAALKSSTPDQRRAKILFRQGSIYQEQGSTQDAVESFSAALKFHPSDVVRESILLKRGTYYMREDQHEAAIQDFTAGLECSSSDEARAMFLFLRGSSQHQRGQKTQAMTDLTAAVGYKPEHEYVRAEIFYLRGVIYADQEEYVKSMEDLIVALACQHSDESLGGKIASKIQEVNSKRPKDH